MRPRTATRILADVWGKGLRHNYWDFANTGTHMARLVLPANGPFLRRVARELGWYASNGPTPIEGGARERAFAAAEWLFRAQDAEPDGGVSQGYFPCEDRAWRRAYPETTGYIISSLIEFARRYDHDIARERALRMARWEISIQMESGAVQGGTVRPRGEQVPAVFNTGMVLDGWASAHQATGDQDFLDAGDRAAEFLLADLGEDGHFRTHGTFVAQERIKTYNCLCAWALYRHAQERQDDARYRAAAVLSVEAAVKQQHPNGWLQDNCLTRPDAPLLHTIAYALQGILEVGVLSGRTDFVEAAVRGTDPILARMSPRGFLHGRFYSDWEPACFSSCLTGSAQLAGICYRLYQVTGSPVYRAGGNRILNYLKPFQALASGDPAIDGALGGSFPLFGSYMSGGYPNWATKYLLDALMLQDAIEGG